jgi:hypothetical protein
MTRASQNCAAEAAAARAGVSLEPFERVLHERTIDASTRALGNAAFAAALQEGSALAPEQAGARALAWARSEGERVGAGRQRDGFEPSGPLRS